MYRFTSIEGVRALLAWWVVFAHLLQHTGIKPNDIYSPLVFIYVGIIPVYIFMFISGFVICHLIIDKQEPYLKYIFRRYMRLAPLMVIAVIIAYILSLSGIDRYWPSEDTLIRLLTQVALLHGIVPDDVYDRASMTFSPPGWSVSLEWQFYIIAPLAVVLISKTQFVGAFILGAFVCFGYMLGLLPDFRTMEIGTSVFSFSKPSHLLSSLHYFLVGIYSYVFIQGKQIHLISKIFGIILIVFCFYTAISDPRLLRWLVLPLWLLIIFTVIFNKSFVSRLLSRKYFRYLGEISYSTYLLHIFVISTITHLLRPYMESKWQFFWVSSLISIPLIILLSVVSYHFVEKPVIKWASKKVASV